MRPVSAADRFDYTLKSDATKSVVLRPLTRKHATRLALEHLDRFGIGVSGEEARAKIRAAIGEVLPEDERAAALATVDDFEAAIEERDNAREALPPDTDNGHVPDEVKRLDAKVEALGNRVTALQRELSREYRPLSRMIRQSSEQSTGWDQLRCQLGIVDWEGFTDTKGEVVACRRSGDMVTDATIEILDPVECEEIAVEVQRLSTLTAADQGNSDSPSGSTTDLTSEARD